MYLSKTGDRNAEEEGSVFSVLPNPYNNDVTVDLSGNEGQNIAEGDKAYFLKEIFVEDWEAIHEKENILIGNFLVFF